MSDILKSYAARNIGTTATIVYTAPVGKTGICIGANIANTTNQSIDIDIILRKSSVDYYILKTTPIPTGAGYVWSGSDQKICLDPGDSFLVKSSIASSIDVIVSVSEI